MARTEGRKPAPPPGDPGDPQGMIFLMEEFFVWMGVRNYSPRTIENRRVMLGFFIKWAHDRGVTKPAEVTKPILERYQRYLYYYRKSNGDPLSFQSHHSRLVPIRAWFKWLARANHVLYNPASDLELPKLEHRLPKFILSASEAEQVINVCDVTDPLGVRDRAILETLYSTGVRRMELIGLKLYDMDTERGTIIVRQGKGRKDRMIPIGSRAIAWIDRYVREVRPTLLVGDSGDSTVFLTHQGEPLLADKLTDLVRQYITAADVGKRGSCHLFRHTMATLMLENGADIRFIQQMLGHARLDTTQIYTQVSIRKLKEIHTATHPAKLERSVSQEAQPEVQ